MSIVIQYDRDTGEIFKVDNHPDWPKRNIVLSWYDDHPKERIKDAGWLTPKSSDNWDDKPKNWIVGQDRNGNPCLKKREEYESEQEIEKEKEKFILNELIKRSKLSPKAKRHAENRLKKLPEKSVN